MQKRLRVYVGDNASNINTAVRFLIRRFHPKEAKNLSVRRLRCFGHIINLAAKAFLFGNDCEAFIDDVEVAERATARDERYLAAEQVKWRSRGPVGKFHNIVAYIRASS